MRLFPSSSLIRTAGLYGLGVSLFFIGALALFFGVHRSVVKADTSWDEYWCATEVYVGANSQQGDRSEWFRYQRTTLPDGHQRTTLADARCGEQGGMPQSYFNFVQPARTHSVNAHPLDGDNILGGTDQVGHGGEENFGFVTKWFVAGTTP